MIFYVIIKILIIKFLMENIRKMFGWLLLNWLKNKGMDV